MQVALDLRGHGGCYFEVPFIRDRLGGLNSQSVQPFFLNVATHGMLTIHARKLAGFNDHHVCEALFKAFGIALHQAVERTERGSSSATKGSRP